jgi:aminoglycoside phosphotransferase (APT) family kinase protein
VTGDGADGAPSPERVKAVVRRGMDLSKAVPISIMEVGAWANINYVYRIDIPGRRFYLKVVPERPKRFPIRLPRERVFSEAEGLRRFHNLAGNEIVTPELLFIDGEEMAMAMTDVGEGREVLLTLLPERFDLLSEQAGVLGRALGTVHGGTRGGGTPRPAQEEVIIRRVIFDGLLAPGARKVFPELWDEVRNEMEEHTECLIHGDLWSKNLLVRSGEPVAVVDFEGVCYGDPAFDLGTLIAVALVPGIQQPAFMRDAIAFTSTLLRAWTSTCGSDEWAGEVVPRAFRATATFLAARGFGPFPYPMAAAVRKRIGELARSLAAEPPSDVKAFRALALW